MSQSVEVAVGDRTLRLSNLEKVLYPESGFTKAEVINYYARIAEHMLPHIRGRCITFRRWPDGVEGKSFFEKNCPGHRPEWMSTAFGPGGSDKTKRPPEKKVARIEYCCLNERAALVWAGNMAALELHTPMALSADLTSPTMVVFDLDPGDPATIVECCQAALELKVVLEMLDLKSWAKTSGSKGLQVYVPINQPCGHTEAANFALAVGQLLVKKLPSLVLVEMKKQLRSGKVFIDWSQNSFHKTTIAAYSLRGRSTPTVSTPVTWEEVESGADGQALVFTAKQVLERVSRIGDLFAGTVTETQTLPKS